MEIFVKNSADKISSKKNKKIKVSPLIPFRVIVTSFSREIYGVSIITLIAVKIEAIFFLKLKCKKIRMLLQKVFHHIFESRQI